MENKANKKKAKLLAADRLGIGILIIIAGLWTFGAFSGFFERTDSNQNNQTDSKLLQDRQTDKTDSNQTEAVLQKNDDSNVDIITLEAQITDSNQLKEPAAETDPDIKIKHTSDLDDNHQQSNVIAEHKVEKPQKDTFTDNQLHQKSPAINEFEDKHITRHINPAEPRGVAFIKAVIKPLNYELTERTWGWRPNDILDFTDNVNNFQLGVLEVTRRTAITLAQDISRTGNTDSYDVNLENAMNWFMIKAVRYWFPSPESKYRAGLEELETYMKRLKKNEARFYTRTDNLIPLLIVYRNLLGSCDQNLVKKKERDGSKVSFFKADNYFYYAKGVASAMHTILEAVYHDFYPTIESRKGLEVLHHAIESCRRAMEIEPFIVTNSELSGILANHRVNMAAPVSHARFYLGVLIKTLST